MAEEFFRRALAWQEENGYNVYHETHRKRFLHSPWVARSFMPKFPQMKVSDTRSPYHHVSDLRWLLTSPTGFASQRLGPVTLTSPPSWRSSPGR